MIMLSHLLSVTKEQAAAAAAAGSSSHTPKPVNFKRSNKRRQQTSDTKHRK